jgi:peptide/nickel transport system substrate-binding protein
MRIRAAAAGLLAAAILAPAACGDDDHDARTSATAAGAPGAATPAPRRGGTLTMLAASDVDFLDPGRTYYAIGYQVAYATQRTLYGYRPGDPAHAIPDLATGPAHVSADGRTITVRIRRGVRFSPPVDREVTSKDIAYAFSRFFSANLGGQYTSYFGDLVGAPRRPTDGPRPVRGIETPDPQTIVFHLRRATAPTFVAALVMQVTAPVPEEYARPFDARSPSTYNTHVVATGPYMVRNDAQGRTVGYRPGKSIDLVRNPNWRRATDIRPGWLDHIRMRTNATDANLAARQVLDGSHMVLDANPPPPILKRVYERQPGQAAQVPSGGYRWLPFTTTVKPFDDLNVRKAVLAGFDREAARRARGGRVAGPIATHFLPPGIPGFEEAGGLRGPGVDYLAADKPGGDPALAAAYLRKAGYPSGRYTGKETFLLIGPTGEPNKGVALVAQQELEQLGFRTRLRLVPEDAAIVDWCQNPRKKVVMCAGGIGWYRDFADPQGMLQPVFDGAAIEQGPGNTNLAQLHDPRIDAAMRRAVTLRGAERARAWGAIDRMVVAAAPGIPFAWDTSTLVRSKDVAGVANAYFDGWDFAYSSLR